MVNLNDYNANKNSLKVILKFYHWRKTLLNFKYEIYQILKIKLRWKWSKNHQRLPLQNNQSYYMKKDNQSYKMNIGWYQFKGKRDCRYMKKDYNSGLEQERSIKFIFWGRNIVLLNVRVKKDHSFGFSFNSLLYLM